MNRLIEYAINGNLEKVTHFVQKYGKPYDSKNDNYSREPFATDVKAGKNSAIYNIHSYHTKVPPQGIEPFIRHYTKPRELVLDPFCGSGMTGIAAIRLDRIPILLELSPSAAFISYNYCKAATGGVQKEFSDEAKTLLMDVSPHLEWLYETKCRKCGQRSLTDYAILSDRFRCPRCNALFLISDVAVDQKGKVSRAFKCPSCAKELRKSQCERIGSETIKVSYSCPKCGRREDSINDFDTRRLTEIERRWKRIFLEKLPRDEYDGCWPLDENSDPLWFPSDRMPEGDEARRNDRNGITHVNHFFTPRNLWMLSRIWSRISRVSNPEVRDKLQWAFTSVIEGSSRLNRERASGLPSKLSGTLYVSSLHREINVCKFFERKAKRIGAISEKANSSVVVAIQTATDLSPISSDSIDYAFTDPPFGGNLMYSELNFLWESWLRHFTNTKEEAIISSTQDKGITEYKELMTKAFKEIYRVLKPNRWMTMVFHNSDGKVWQAIQEGLSEAGFVIGMIGTFDKMQRSFKQVTSSGAVGYDVVVNCYKPKATIKNGIEGKTTKSAIIGYLADYLQQLPLTHCDERTARMLHSKTIGFFMLQNRPLEKLSFEDFQTTLKKNFRSIDGFWYLPYQRPRIEGQRRLFGFITTEAEAIEWLEELLRVPRKQGDITPEFFKALGPQRLQKELEELLQENFVEEKGIWRNPTTAEKERLVKRLTDKTARQIDEYLKGTIERSPTETELCEWIEFCYNSGLYQEGSDLLHHINEEGVAAELFKKTKKIAEVCRIKAWEGRSE